MSDNEEKRGGSTVAGIIGGATGGVAAFKLSDTGVARKGIKAALDHSEHATDAFTNATSEIMKNNKSLDISAGSIGALKDIKTGAEVSKVRFFTDKKAGKFAMYFADNEGGALVKGIKKLPEGFETGKSVVDPEKIKTLFAGEKAFAKVAADVAEKDLLTGIRKAAGTGFGFKTTGATGKVAIIGATVGGVAIGGIALSKMFGGGKHTARIEAERAQAPAQAAGRA